MNWGKAVQLKKIQLSLNLCSTSLLFHYLFESWKTSRWLCATLETPSEVYWATLKTKRISFSLQQQHFLQVGNYKVILQWFLAVSKAGKSTRLTSTNTPLTFDNKRQNRLISTMAVKQAVKLSSYFITVKMQNRDLSRSWICLVTADYNYTNHLQPLGDHFYFW